jgi:molybdopterin-guanine dinucleotide biosynthesis protein A
MRLTGVILAGGQATRLGRHKPNVAIGGRPLIQWVADALEPVASELVVSLSPGQARPLMSSGLPVRFVEDEARGLGPAAGLAAALRVVSAKAALVLGCDTPFVSPDLLRYLASAWPGHGAVVPVTEEGPQPLHGVYGVDVLPAVEQALRDGVYRMQRLLDRLEVRYVPEAEVRSVDPELRSFLNVNTPQALRRAQRLAARLEVGGVQESGDSTTR